MIKCVSIDGPDGSGKSTLISGLSEVYNVAALPRFYMTGIVPIEPEERREWFRRENVFDTTRLYISGHKLRISAAGEFKRGLHYKFMRQDKKEPLILIDRGALSVEAFAYAAIRKGTDWPGDKINAYLKTECDMQAFSSQIIDLSVLIFDRNTLTEILDRRAYDEDDRKLVCYQHEYYCTHEFDGKKVRVISPALSQEMMLAESLRIIQEMEDGNVQGL